MTGRGFHFFGAGVLALAVYLHLFLFHRGFYSIGWDESARTLDAHAWVTGWSVNEVWLPFYRICVGLALRVHPDLFLTPRVVSFLFGLGSLVAAAWLAHELFANRRTTLLTLVLAALFSQRVALSLAPLSDIMLTLVILSAAALLVRWLRTESRRALYSCALVGALATTIRYEGWIFAAAFFCVVAGSCLFASSRMKWRDLVFFGAILFAFPGWWSVGSSSVTNQIGAIVTAAPRYSQWQILRKNPLVEFVLTNGLTLNLIGAASIIQLARRGPWRYQGIVAALFGPLAAVSLALLLIHGAQTGPSWRMIGVWSMLVLPFTAAVLASGLTPSAGRRRKNMLAGAIALVLGVFVYDAFRLERASSWAFPPSDRRAGEYLNDLINAEPKTKVLIESSSFVFLNILVASQHPQAFVTNSVPERESVPILASGGPVREALDGRGIKFLMFRTDAYKRLLDGNPAVVKLEQFGAWSVYRLTN